MEELSNPAGLLEKWESPLLTEMSKNVREVQESLVTSHLNMQTIKNRLSRQEYALNKIQYGHVVSFCFVLSNKG